MRKIITIIVLMCFLAANVFAASADSSTVTAISISLVNQDPDPAVAGDVVEVRLGVENTGGDPANDLIVEIVPAYPFELVPGESNIQKVGTIKGYQYDENVKIIKYQIRVDKDTTAGSYELKVKYYEEGSLASAEKSLSIDVQTSEGAEVIYIDQTTLIPGKQTPLKFTINNVGNAPLRSLTFKWENEDKVLLPVGSDNTKYVKYIDIGESAELEYNVIADTNADPGLYELSLYLTYDDPLTGGEKQISTIAGVYVGGATDFDIAFSESSAGEISFSVANIGSNPASSVSVMIPKQSGWKVMGSNSMIIGNLNKGDYTVASFSLQSAQSKTTQQKDMTREQLIAQRESQTENSLKIQISYTDTMGVRNLVEKEVSVNAQMLGQTSPSGTTSEAFRGKMQQQSFFSKYKWHILVIILVVVLIVGNNKYKKQKIVNPNLKLKDFLKISNLKNTFKKNKK